MASPLVPSVASDSTLRESFACRTLVDELPSWQRLVRREFLSISTEDVFANFDEALDTWIERPHVVNKRVAGKKLLWAIDGGKCEDDDGILGDLKKLRGRTTRDSTLLRSAVDDLLERTNCGFLGQLLKLFAGNESVDFSSVRSSMCDELIGKKNGNKTFQLVVRTAEPSAYFLSFGYEDHENIHSKLWIVFYEIALETSSRATGFSVRLSVMSDPLMIVPSAGVAPAWLASTLLGKLVKWTETPIGSTFGHSLRLLKVEDYAENYSRLKTKYGAEMVKNWTEVTDPQKFVFEDVAIAAYLVTLWRRDDDQEGTPTKPSFVDLGCGNGLLVHILTQEGYPGYGIDVRRRKIWNRFSPRADLREKSVVPSDVNLFPETDWLIGNHSDELTPWIPIIAARSSKRTNFFLLPCCFWDFDKKFVRETSTQTQYRSYLNYIREICSAAGFDAEEDVLRIPSTKRVCLVGRKRNYEETTEEAVERKRKAFIGGRTSASTIEKTNDAGSDWTSSFKPRDKEEPVRNCSKIDKSFKDAVANAVFLELLSAPPLQTPSEKSVWNAGGELTMKRVVDLLSSNDLKTLKRECGGLKTLLKNHHQVFRLVGDGVRLKDWRFEKKKELADDDERNRRRKTSLCWFFQRHPQGCPLTPLDCDYAHGERELRPFQK